MKNYSTKKPHSVFTPALFIESVLPHLRSFNIPESCIMSLVPGMEGSVQMPVKKQIRFLNRSKILLFDKPVPHIFIFGGVGAPVSVMILEILIDLGVHRIAFLGTCGILSTEIRSGEIIIPTAFIREEGTSAHYIDPQIPIKTDGTMNKLIMDALNKAGMIFHQGLHWTTDAPFRESSEKISRYRQQGCLSVDMEMSALFAAAQHHNLNPAALLVGNDLMHGNRWSPPSPSYVVVKKQIRRCLKILQEFLSQDWPF